MATNEQSWAAQMNSVRQQMATQNKKAQAVEKAGATEAIASPIQMATQKALRLAWLNLITTYGLSFLYIGFHAIMKYVANSQFFCRLGAEGLFGLTPPPPKGVPGALAGSELAEKIAVGVVCLLLLLILLIVLTILCFIGAIVIRPIEFFSELGLSDTWTFIRTVVGIETSS